jgi:hypothetical protein
MMMMMMMTMMMIEIMTGMMTKIKMRLRQTFDDKTEEIQARDHFSGLDFSLNKN